MKNRGFWVKLKIGMAALAVILIFGNTRDIYAAGECRLMQISVEGDKIVSYVECGSKVEGAKAQVAQSACENVGIIQPEDVLVHTIILLDNSLSISEINRENIKNILKQYIQEIPDNESISFAVFGEELQFFVEKSQNKEEMLQIVEKIEFHDQDTYLTDFLFEVIEKIEEDSEYTRIIIISDGVDNRAVGITKDELMSKLDEISRPVYTIGHIYKENSDELKNMFALSRATAGKEFLIEDYEDLNQMLIETHNLSNIYSIKMDIPQNVMDGGKKNILLNVHTEYGDVEVTGEASMPFALEETEPEAEEKENPEPIPEPEPEPISMHEADPEPIPEPNPMPVQESESTGIGVDKIAGAIIAVSAVIVLIIYQKKNKKKKKQAAIYVPIPQEVPEKDETEILEGRYLLVLRDRTNPERIFRYPLDGHVVVGRNTDIVQIAVDYNLTVSGQHCEFYMKNHRFFIRDMNSANHTYMDGKVVNGEEEIISGSIIRLGEVEFSIEIMPI